MADLFRCRTCGGTFPDEPKATAHMIVIHDWILGPDGPQPPEAPPPTLYVVQEGDTVASILRDHRAYDIRPSDES